MKSVRRLRLHSLEAQQALVDTIPSIRRCLHHSNHRLPRSLMCHRRLFSSSPVGVKSPSPLHPPYHPRPHQATTAAASSRSSSDSVPPPLHPDTLLVHGGFSPELSGPFAPTSMPIYQTATFSSPTSTTTGRFDYTRSGNPTRQALQQQLAHVEQAQHVNNTAPAYHTAVEG
jgi:hypothetical protein